MYLQCIDNLCALLSVCAIYSHLAMQTEISIFALFGLIFLIALGETNVDHRVCLHPAANGLLANVDSLVCLCQVVNGLPAIHLSSSNPNLLSVDMTESSGSGCMSLEVLSQTERLHEQFYNQAKGGELLHFQLDVYLDMILGFKSTNKLPINCSRKFIY